MPVKTVIQKRGNFLPPRSPMRLVLEVDERCISEFKGFPGQAAANTATNHRPVSYGALLRASILAAK
jgi:hypothetical protein